MADATTNGSTQQHPFGDSGPTVDGINIAAPDNPKPINHKTEKPNLENQNTQTPKSTETLNPEHPNSETATSPPVPESSPNIAEVLDEDGTIHLAYSVVDALSSGNSAFSLFFLLYFAGTADEMREVMLTPGGIAGIVCETTFIVTFAFLAAYFDVEKQQKKRKKKQEAEERAKLGLEPIVEEEKEDEENAFQNWVIKAYPYLRTAFKGIKNSVKGIRSAFTAITLFGLLNISYLLLPVGLALGIFAAVNRILLQLMIDARKDMMKANEKIISEVKALKSLSLEDCQERLKTIQKQTLAVRVLAYIGVSLGGLLDGLYLYAGALTVAILAPQALIAMVVLCAFYTIMCVINRAYEEYVFQIRLLIIQTQCELMLTAKTVETSYATLLALQEKTEKTEDDLAQINIIRVQLSELIASLEKSRTILKQQVARTYLIAFLGGVKNALYAYSALSSLVFLIAAILTVAGVAFPPILLILSICMGMAFILGFGTYSLIEHGFETQNQTKQEPDYDRLTHMQEALAAGQEAEPLSQEALRSSINEGIALASLPPSSTPDALETVRATASGIVKGAKCVDACATPAQIIDAQGHGQNGLVAYIFDIIMGLGFGFIFGGRAVAKLFGRPLLGDVNLVKGNAPVVLEEKSAESSEPQKTAGVVPPFAEEIPTHSTPAPEPTPVSQPQPAPVSKPEDSPKPSPILKSEQMEPFVPKESWPTPLAPPPSIPKCSTRTGPEFDAPLPYAGKKPSFFNTRTENPAQFHPFQQNPQDEPTSPSSPLTPVTDSEGTDSICPTTLAGSFTSVDSATSSMEVPPSRQLSGESYPIHSPSATGSTNVTFFLTVKSPEEFNKNLTPLASHTLPLTYEPEMTHPPAQYQA